jgi:hypothetical protein
MPRTVYSAPATAEGMAIIYPSVVAFSCGLC